MQIRKAKEEDIAAVAALDDGVDERQQAGGTNPSGPKGG